MDSSQVGPDRLMSLFHESEIAHSILENLPVGLCVVDMQKRIHFWSDGAERITGHLRHEVIGHSCVGESLLHCDQPGCEFCSEECPLSRCMKTGQPAESIGFLHHKAGHEIPVRLRAVPVRNDRGSIIGALETFEDQQPASLDHRDADMKLSGCVDRLTDVASRSLIEASLRQTLASFMEAQIPFALMFLRVEELGHFRACYGPEAASSLLRVVARTLEASVWKSDVVGRWSDDQFLVILNGCRNEALQSVRERVRHMLANDSIEWWGERRSLRVSIGQVVAETGDTVESLMERAQVSLNSACAMRARAAASGRDFSESS